MAQKVVKSKNFGAVMADTAGDFLNSIGRMSAFPSQQGASLGFRQNSQWPQIEALSEENYAANAYKV